MQYYVRQWPDKTASLLAEDGITLVTFYSLEQAVMACRLWREVIPLLIESHSGSPVPEFCVNHPGQATSISPL